MNVYVLLEFIQSTDNGNGFILLQAGQHVNWKACEYHEKYWGRCKETRETGNRKEKDNGMEAEACSK